MLFAPEVESVFEEFLNAVFGDVEGLLEGFNFVDEVAVVFLDVFREIPGLDVFEGVKGDDEISECRVFLK